MNEFFFSIYLILHATLGFTQPITEMSSRSRKIMFMGSRARPVNKWSKKSTLKTCVPTENRTGDKLSYRLSQRARIVTVTLIIMTELWRLALHLHV
jgi:hypothetical protein